MNNSRKVLAVLLAVALTGWSAAAQRQIKGRVTDDSGAPLPAATVMVKGSSNGVLADMDGKYSINAASSAVLVAEYMGYIPQEVKVGDKTTIDFSLAEDSNMLEDVVVIAYGTAKKTDLTGSVANVKMDDVKSTPVLSIDNALQGRIAGADFMSTDGAPGSTTTIRIRGTRSISASNEPLIVVDGIIDAINDLNDINSDDIASISVLKDASSTAIYGSRGANGVIIITTKSGSDAGGKPRISFKADFGVSRLPKSLDLMNASEFALYRNDYAYFGKDPSHSSVGPDTPLSQSVYKDPMSLGKGTDWIGEITRTAIVQNYSLSVMGGDHLHNYYVSLSYNDTEGIIQDSGQKRFTGRIKMDRQLFPFLRVGYNGSYTFRHTDETKASIGGTSWWNSAQYLSPMIKVTDIENPLYNLGQRINTPRVLIDLNTHYTERNSMNHSFDADLEPVKNLHIKSILSYYLYTGSMYRYIPGNLPAKTEDEGGQATRTENHSYSLSSETTARYDLKAGRHSLVPLLGFSVYKSDTDNFSLTGKGYMDDQILWNNMNAVVDKNTYSASTSMTGKTKMSAFARADYNYDSRYYLTATLRYDGASNFARNRKWAPFPSAAFRWNISNENFMKGAAWIDNLSLRLSAGKTGNDAISSFRSLAALSSTTDGYLFNGTQPVAFYRSRLAQPELGWETTTSYNAALDLSVLKGRLTVTAEAYSSNTTDLLLSVQVANQTGYSSHLMNLGRISNRGIELSFDSMNIAKKDFQWTSSFTISHNRQRVEDVGTEEFVSAMNSPGNNPYMIYGYVKGYPLNSLWGFQYAGVWKSDEERQRNKVTKTYVSTTAKWDDGTPRYYDTNHDGVLNQDDLVYQGNADPYIYGGLQNTFYYKNFKLGVYFAYSLGGKIYNYSEFYQAGGMYTNQYRYMLNAWHPERNPESNIPRACYTDVSIPSDFLIHDASYLRLKTVSIGYTLDLSKTRSKLRDATFSLSGDNLLLWKYYNGFDPDVSSEGTSSTLRRVDLGAYPKSRTITFSIQVRY
ncbi:MAG: TonB-dependent receptor [Bacteroidales bacterium]|nr:TonB-dependent receptor [Bacteroidales bacterium]